MAKPFARLCCALLAGAALLAGCSSYQPTKNVWKGTKGLWYTYVSPPASVDYAEKGNLSPRALALTNSMMGIDVELTRLERAMLNADRPPTREWLNGFLASFPWVNGFAGIRYDGTILGQEPATPMKTLDFIPLLYEDKKQGSRALRADVQNTPLGPEVLLAVPLYDGTYFLGVVEANFDMRSLMQYSQTPQDVVILSPQALLWPGKYDFAATPLAGVDWEQTVRKSSTGVCSNANGSFYYAVRYLGNVPLVFAVAESGNFPAGNGDVSQGVAFFPKDRPKLPPPPHEKRKELPDFAKGLNPQPEAAAAEAEAGAPAADSAVAGARAQGTDIQPGSQDSVLLRRKAAERRPRVRERQLEGENIVIDHAPRPRKPRHAQPLPPATGLGLSDDVHAPTLSGGRPSPFGPRDGEAARPADPSVPTLPGGRPSPFGPRDAAPATPAAPAGQEGAAPAPGAAPAAAEKPAQPAPAPAAVEKPAQPAPAPGGTGETSAPAAQQPAAGSTGAPATLPGGRPSPFGPRN